MEFKNFRLWIVIRVAILTFLIFILVWGLLNTDWQITPIVCGLLIVLCISEMIHYVEKTNREFKSFLEFIYHHDFSVSISNQGKGRVFTELGSAYKLITGEYQRLNLEKEAHYQYLESVIEHVSVALICLDREGNVVLMNQQAKKLFKAPYLPTVNSFSRIDTRLPEILQVLVAGEHHLTSIRIDEESLQLVLFATEFQLLGEYYKLISFQNIRDELDQREIDSWQKLIRVLTHEIMNSVTPIISLTSVIKEILVSSDETHRQLRQLSTEEGQDLLRSIDSIESRSKGLMTFVQAYSNLTNMPSPDFTDVKVMDLLMQVQTIMLPELERARIEVELDCADKKLMIRADPQMIEQVLINLIKNAIESLAGRQDPKIILRAFVTQANKILITVIDNGPGIEPENLENIFVPFFTTKHKGSGIGLSISRQIMFVNKGVLSVKTSLGNGCMFILRFNR